MDTILDTFKGSYTLVPILSLFAIFVLFLDSKIQDYEPEGKDYIKVGVIVAFASWVAIVINTETFKDVSDEILNGTPPF